MTSKVKLLVLEDEVLSTINRYGKVKEIADVRIAYISSIDVNSESAQLVRYGFNEAQVHSMDRFEVLQAVWKKNYPQFPTQFLPQNNDIICCDGLAGLDIELWNLAGKPKNWYCVSNSYEAKDSARANGIICIEPRDVYDWFRTNYSST